MVPSLRKPDFQRETNQWTAGQVVTFLKSFVDNELVPSVILWKSPTRIFVIDGAHRLSALMAWIRDDYGDGSISEKFYSGNISDEQKRLAASLRRQVNSQIGSFSKFKEVMMDAEAAASDPLLVKRASSASTRTLSLQWVEGDAEKAETSFFKINKQGTPLDRVEERLLRERRCPIAISARSVVRAGSGHKYWSSFDEEKQKEIESRAKKLHELLFAPELKFPIKTLNLPHGGKASPIEAYNILMDLLAYAIIGNEKIDRTHYLYSEDSDGQGTIRAIGELSKVMERLTGNGISSLGLHPAVFLYSQSGRHWDIIFISIVNVFAKAIRKNDKEFFKRFTQNRAKLEELFLKHKALVGQANIAIRSKSRVEKWSGLIEDAARGKVFHDGVTQQAILEALELSGKLIASEISEVGSNFSEKTKSAIFLSSSIQKSHKCPYCGGHVLVEKSVSYDHVKPKALGGDGSVENGQLMHPYCNSLKGSDS